MNKRQVLLLEYLMKNIEYLSANQLADRYKVSNKTVYQDIDKINEFLKDNLIETKVIKIPRKGIKLLSQLENKKIPVDIDYQKVNSLRIGAVQKLEAVRPASIGQASRISGVSPADITVLMVYLETLRGGKS